MSSVPCREVQVFMSLGYIPASLSCSPCTSPCKVCSRLRSAFRNSGRRRLAASNRLAILGTKRNEAKQISKPAADSEDVPLMELMYLVLYACEVRVTVGDSGLGYACVTSFGR